MEFKRNLEENMEKFTAGPMSQSTRGVGAIYGQGEGDDEEDCHHHSWSGVMQGPKGSVYENGIFFLLVSFPPTYPSEAPRIRFLTEIYHMNVSRETGRFQTEWLCSQWAPSISMTQVFQHIYDTLEHPDPCKYFREEERELF